MTLDQVGFIFLRLGRILIEFPDWEQALTPLAPYKCERVYVYVSLKSARRIGVWIPRLSSIGSEIVVTVV